ncbi:hypothetical protein SGFS_022690 [Streptomyces graminofaciens]|uniref:DUF3500 domain-containing protein n=1 Tax=Streptomyces graminofaciens TaxID=68212 RepID=A0ABN5VD96_9ACTN|nr:DUF3500 domain-containing protein [Streptomyces graminofaciens]BBC30975.1 hypothetical protein SGFS_022690 [Streptomyces graminofaciens]
MTIETTGTTEVYEAPETIRRMLVTTWALLYSMDGAQRRECEFSMDDPGRVDWDFIPKPDRQGVPLAGLNSHQRTLVHSLLAASLSEQGYSQVLQIMAMENILREREQQMLGAPTGDFRNSDQYFLAFFGRPGFEDTWGWRFLGHHISLSYTIIGQRWLTVTPCNLGAQPASAGLLAPLAHEEDQAFALLRSLTPVQRDQTVIHTVAPADYATRQVPFIGKVEYPDHEDLGIPWYRITDEDREALKFSKDDPKGVCGKDLTTDQGDALVELVGTYLWRMPGELARKQLARVEREGLDNLYFCWAGGQEPGTPHYFRIQGSTVLIEFDNAIDNGNHIHSMWRDYRNDLGHDLLAEHYERERATGHHLTTRLRSSVPDK